MTLAPVLRRHKRRPSSRGLSLIELMLVLAVLGVLVGVAVPEFSGYVQRKRVESTAQELATSVRFARSLPLQTGNEIFVRFGATANFTCYTVHSTPGLANCNCERHPQPACTTSSVQDIQPEEYRTVIVPRDSGLTLAAVPVSTQFFRATGMPSVASMAVTVSSTRGGSLRVITNSAGLPRLCAVSGHPEYGACP